MSALPTDEHEYSVLCKMDQRELAINVIGIESVRALEKAGLMPVYKFSFWRAQYQSTSNKDAKEYAEEAFNDTLREALISTGVIQS